MFQTFQDGLGYVIAHWRVFPFAIRVSSYPTILQDDTTEEPIWVPMWGQWFWNECDILGFYKQNMMDLENGEHIIVPQFFVHRVQDQEELNELVS